ncbi:hypothetical protein NHQ30_011144 [Ciborinia camelliae]|nr:hypothetical protein NHQ30_011144 [Ciborinia camelliae]
MASQAPPNGPGRGISQLYPTASVLGTTSKAPSADAHSSGVSQVDPSSSPYHAQTLRSPSKAPSAAPSQLHNPSVRPSQSPSHHLLARPSHAATLRGRSQAAPVHTLNRGASQYSTVLQTQTHGPSIRANDNVTELRRDAPSNYQASRQPAIVLQSPTNDRTLLQRDAATINQRQSAQHTLLQRDTPTVNRHQSAQHTLLQRDKSKMPSAMSAIKEASVTPIIGPSKKFENAPSVRSILHSPKDIQMASRQSTINELQGPEREAQEAWALGKLGKLDTGCPQNYGWSRRDDGYICEGGSHYITDVLLTEGMGGMFAVKNKHDWKNRSEGPYYWVGKNDQGKNLFMKIVPPEND